MLKYKNWLWGSCFVLVGLGQPVAGWTQGQVVSRGARAFKPFQMKWQPPPTLAKWPIGVGISARSFSLPPVAGVMQSVLDQRAWEAQFIRQIVQRPLTVALPNAPAVGRPVFPGKDRIDAVIFDMDGTLLDSLPAWDHAAAKYLRTLGVELPQEMEIHIKKISLLEGAHYLKEQLHLTQTPQELLDGTLAYVRQQYLTSIPPKPGVVHLLRVLHAQGIKISVATASDRALAMRAFERVGLAPYIDFVIDCDEVGVGKLSPDIYEEALRRLGTAKARTLVVEDALYALKTAKAVGFPTAGVAEPFHTQLHQEELQREADYFFSSFENSFP